MTTDPFTEAARAEAERRHPAPEIETGAQLGYTQTQIREVVRRTFTNAAEWARAHLAAQEPTDAEIEAAARAISAEQDRRIGLKAGTWWGGAEYRRNFAREDARAALRAARAARRDEKDKP